MHNIINIGGEYCILATSALADERKRVLKHSRTLGVFDRYLDVQHIGLNEQGMFHKGTRHLSRLEFLINDTRPLLLNSGVSHDNMVAFAELTNPDFLYTDRKAIPRGTLHISKKIIINSGLCYLQINLTNYGTNPIEFDSQLIFEADFSDMFEVRGMTRKQHGIKRTPTISESSVTLEYDGLDKQTYTTIITHSQEPNSLSADTARFHFSLETMGQAEFSCTFSCNDHCPPACTDMLSSVLETATEKTKSGTSNGHCSIGSSNEQFNEFINRSLADLHMLTTKEETGVYPYAGIPWYNAPFGRDGIITALQTLWINPEIAHGVLHYLATHQSDKNNADQDTEPGKILHEVRSGEMVRTGEIPFGQYYGSVDSTPLFLILAGKYARRTGDTKTIKTLWPNIMRGLKWLEEYADLDGDGFIEYQCRAKRGLANQGWKDSFDSIFHLDGTLAKPPIALCEVQGYAYAAMIEIAWMAETILNQPELATRLTEKAALLKKAFNDKFWDSELEGYVIAFDGNKKPCRIKASNMGHCLYTGIVPKKRAKKVVKTLFSETMYSGWGIRTVASDQPCYNPMSYHNGSIWPHDNSIIAAGLSRHGFQREAGQILSDLFKMSLYMDLQRLPELFCGFPRKGRQGPTLYPVACSPQAWACGTPFLILKACLGLRIDARNSTIHFHNPILPNFMSHLTIRNLQVGEASIDLQISRDERRTTVSTIRGDGDIAIAIR